MEKPLELSQTVDSGCLVVHGAGEVDMANAEVLQHYLLDHIDRGFVHVVVDLSDVEFIDSTGLGALVAAWRRSKERGGSLRVAGATGNVQAVLEITELDVVLDRHERVSEAVATAVAERDDN